MTVTIIAFAAGSLIGFLVNEIWNSKRIDRLQRMVKQKAIKRRANLWEKDGYPPIPKAKEHSPEPEMSTADKLEEIQKRIDQRRYRQTDIFKAERERLKEIARQAQRQKFDIKHDMGADL